MSDSEYRVERDSMGNFGFRPMRCGRADAARVQNFR